MTTPFLQVRPRAIKLKVTTRFPSRLFGGIGIDIVKANGDYTVNLDYAEIGPTETLPSSPNLYVLIYDSVLDTYYLVKESSFFGIPEAPVDGTVYGRKDSTWVAVLALSGGTLTGPLVLNANPSVPLGAATKQYVDSAISGTGGITDAPSDSVVYGRKNATWVPANDGTVPENSQSANYTTVLADAGKFIYHPASDANARTFTIAANASVAYALGTVISFVNMSANALTIAIASDTMTLGGTGTTGSRTLAQYGCCTALKIDTTAWIISGTGLT